MEKYTGYKSDGTFSAQKKGFFCVHMSGPQRLLFFSPAQWKQRAEALD